MSIPQLVFRAARLAMAVLALSLAATAISPAISHAQPSQGTAGDSGFCDALLDRLKRYHAIASDPGEPQSVRAFYRGRANALLNRAKHAGCAWAASVTITGVTTLPTTTVTGRTAAVAGLSGPAGRGRHRARFDRLSATRRGVRRAAKPAATGGGTPVPSSQTPVAIKAIPTGNAQQDGYCTEVAKLIDEAELAGDTASGNGNDAEANAWWDLADYYVDRATENGCRFTLALTAASGVRVPGAVATRG